MDDEFVQPIYEAFNRLHNRQGNRMTAQVKFMSGNYGSITVSHLEWKINETEQARKDLIRARIAILKGQIDA